MHGAGKCRRGCPAAIFNRGEVTILNGSRYTDTVGLSGRPLQRPGVPHGKETHGNTSNCTSFGSHILRDYNGSMLDRAPLRQTVPPVNYVLAGIREAVAAVRT